MNISSKGGIGFSAGVKGLRVSTNRTGTYLRAGRGGFSYRTKLGGPAKKSQSWSAPTSPKQAMSGDRVGGKANTTATWLMGIGAFILFSILGAPAFGSFVLALLVAGITYFYTEYASGLPVPKESAAQSPLIPSPALTTPASIATHQTYTAGSTRRTSAPPKLQQFVYDLEAPETVINLAHTLEIIGIFLNTERAWLNVQTVTSSNLKSAAATSIDRRLLTVITPQSGELPGFKLLGLTTPGGHDEIIFLPDRLYQKRSGQITEWFWEDLMVEVGLTKFLEEGSVPADALQEGQTWLYLNKDGSPDRRFAGNRVVPVMAYGFIILAFKRGDGDLDHITFHLSNAEAAVRAAKAFMRLSGVVLDVDEVHEAVDSEGPTSSALGQAYAVLGLEPGQPLEIVTATYRELVKLNHPDRVAHLAPEFGELAHKRMREINAAYEALKFGGE